MKNQSLAENIHNTLRLELEIEDSETIAELNRHEEAAERHQYAVTALRLGVLALRSARGEIDKDAIKREGEVLVSNVRRAMAEQSQVVQKTRG